MPACEALKEKLEAAERGTAESVDGLIIVADNDDVAWFRAQEMQQFELRDVGVLEFIHEDVSESFLKLAAALGVYFE